MHRSLQHSLVVVGIPVLIIGLQIGITRNMAEGSLPLLSVSSIFLLI